MIKIKQLKLRNFMSCGNVEQVIDFDKTNLTLIIGDNIDLGSNGSRNGVGKSAIGQALTYALYGEALTDIKNDNLVNKINSKNMQVSVIFEINNKTYEIQRGRKPNYFKFLVDDKDTSTDEAQGEIKDSQKEINELLGMSVTMFRHLILLNTFTEPFLSLGAAKQREIIEELLGITLLSQKAENLKKLIKETKTNFEQEEFKIRTVKQSNERIQSTINDIVKKEKAWDLNHTNTIKNLQNSIEKLADLNIDEEIQNQRDLENYNQLFSIKNQLSKDIDLKSKHLNQFRSQLDLTIKNYDKASNNECPTCGQGIHDDKIKNELETKLITLDTQIKLDESEIQKNTDEMSIVQNELNKMSKPSIIYKNLEQALNHKNTLDQLIKELDKEENTKNPYSEQALSLHLSMQEITYDELNKLSKDREHQEFLLKLLTNKDSFIRKKIIDQNLTYLNVRLNDYLDKLGLPHTIKFMNDLSVEISMLGNSYDFGNFSRGERTRLVFGLSMAFRDIFENSNTPINLLFVDEVIDQGIDQSGIEKAVEILKEMSRIKNRNIFLISHKEDLISRVSSVLTVVKENGFTTFLDHND